MSASLRIAQLSTPHERTPPEGYGSINRIVADLTEELVARSHDVHLFANADSQTSATLHSIYDRVGEKFLDFGRDWLHALFSLREISGFDVLHNHNLFSGTALGFLADARASMTTVHFDHVDDYDFLRRVSPQHWVVQSASQRRRLAWLDTTGTMHMVRPGIDVAAYRGADRDDGYLLILGQVGEHKGIREAIETARKVGMPLVIAGPVPSWHERYFEEYVRPELDQQVQYVGVVGGQRRLDLLQGARALLMPSQAEETFGLACVEAMASGTAVVVSAAGALPELVVDGVTGFVARDVSAAVAGVERVAEISPAVCRAHVEQHFTIARMTDDYLELYRRLCRVDEERGSQC
ncbi:MAG: glycosyltransferase family 4 protein [Pseudonocardiaceae bacterium]